MKVGEKEEQLRVLKAKRVEQPKRNARFDQALAAAQGRTLDAALLGTRIEFTPPTAPAAAQPQETTMPTKPKKTTKTATRKPAAAKTKPKAKTASTANARTKVAGRPDGLRQAQMLDLALRDEGATEKAICAALGWKKCRVTLKRVADKVGAKLKGEKNVAGATVWFATMPKAAS